MYDNTSYKLYVISEGYIEIIWRKTLTAISLKILLHGH